MEDGLWLKDGTWLERGEYDGVLILVVMEDGLWLPGKEGYIKNGFHVLILVVMEDGLWPIICFVIIGIICVLILVVMEDGLWPATNGSLHRCRKGLNPCCDGRWSLTGIATNSWTATLTGLNPCCDGRWSLTGFSFELKFNNIYVLILVVMEDGLWQVVSVRWWTQKKSLNPCCDGRWSLTMLMISPDSTIRMS